MDQKDGLGTSKLDSTENLKLNMNNSQIDFSHYGRNAPPSYEKMQEQIQMPTSSNFYKNVVYLKNASRESYKLLTKFATIFFCTITITVILIILMAIPSTMIVIGSFSMKSCPMEKMIPIWLIVFGALAIVKNLSTLFQRLRYIKIRGEEGQHTSNTLLNIFDSFIAVFLLIWFICGNIWTYGNFNKIQSIDKTNTTTYCNQLVYYFSFWIITSIYILVCLACFLFFCTVCFTIFMPTKK